MDPALLKTIIEGGSFAIIALMFIWFFWKGVPMVERQFEKMEQRHREDSQKDRDLWLGTIRDHTTALNGNTTKLDGVVNRVDDLREKFDRFSQHTMRG